jgi:hypothetical protein
MEKPAPRFAWGMSSVASTVLTLVLFATYLGIGALAHDSQFSLGWVLGSTLLVWAGPAQIILISTLGSGATGGAGGDCGDGERDPAVSDGGVGVAADADAADKAPPPGAGDAFHRRHPVGRVLPPAAKSAA